MWKLKKTIRFGHGTDSAASVKAGASFGRGLGARGAWKLTIWKGHGGERAGSRRLDVNRALHSTEHGS